MRKKDILGDVIDGRSTARQAQAFFSEVIASPSAAEVAELTGMSQFEYTAKCHGLPIKTLALWRSKGWPDVCAVCGDQVEITEYGWWAGHKHKGRYCLKHIKCMNKGL